MSLCTDSQAKGSLSNLTSSTVLTLNPADEFQDAQWIPEVVDPMRPYNSEEVIRSLGTQAVIPWNMWL